jgi:hypothetical protein
MDMVSRQPRLLLQETQGLPQRLQAVIDKLQTLHPAHMERVVAGARWSNIQRGQPWQHTLLCVARLGGLCTCRPLRYVCT